MDGLTSLRVFAAIAEARSFAAAAERLGLSPAMASKHIQSLEKRVGSRLLNRTSRSVSLTETGSLYAERVRALLDGLDEAEATIGRTLRAPRGTLKVSLPAWLANPVFARSVSAFGRLCPEVVLDLDFSGRTVNLVEEGFDLAVRSRPTLDEGLVARKLAEIAFHLVAAPDLLRRLGEIRTIGDLRDAPFLAYSHLSGSRQIRFGPDGRKEVLKFRTVMRSGTEAFLLLAARDGLGLAFMPSILVAEDLAAGRLVHVLPDLLTPVAPLFAVYPTRDFLPAKTRSFLDFLAEEMARETV